MAQSRLDSGVRQQDFVEKQGRSNGAGAWVVRMFFTLNRWQMLGLVVYAMLFPLS